ncbi:MAG: thiamine phosphate synthase [Pseudomonadota bacterium]
MMSAELYLLTPPQIGEDFAATLRRTLNAGDVAAVQLRLKNHDEGSLDRLAPPLVQICHEAGAMTIFNDRPDLAARYGCGGVHIGQEDAPYAEARSAVGAKGVVGVTCHDSRHLAMLAAERGADYVAFGAMFQTATKTPKSRASLDLLTWWSELFEAPCVAIGGITVDNAADVINAGADYLAVSGGIWAHQDGPEKAVEQFSELLAHSS